MGVIAYHHFIEHVQWHIVIELFCQPIWDWFIEAARVAGAVKKNEIVPVGPRPGTRRSTRSTTSRPTSSPQRHPLDDGHGLNELVR